MSGELIAAIYARVSTTKQEQEGTSLHSQVADCRAEAARLGWGVSEDHVYEEVYSGGELWERDGLTALRAAMRAGQVQAVVCHRIDRLSRDPVHLGVVLSEAEHHGVRVHFVTEDLDDSPDAELLRFVRGYIGKVERQKIRSNTMRGRREAVANGKVLGGRWLLYGYEKDPETGRLLVNPEKAQVVLRVFREAAAGKPVRAIATGLTQDGIPTPSGAAKVWSWKVIGDWLRHPWYKGDGVCFTTTPEAKKRPGYKTKRTLRRPPEEWQRMREGAVPAIVPVDLWERVQRQLVVNKAQAPRNNRDPEATLLRAGHALCGHCGCRLRVSRHTSRGKHRVLYCCQRANHAPEGCTRHSIEAHRLDGPVWSYIERVLTQPGAIRREIARLKDDDTTDADLATLDRRLADVTKKQGNLAAVAAHLDDAPDAAAVLAGQLRDLANQKRDLEKEQSLVQARQQSLRTSQTTLEGIEAECQRAAGVLSTLSYQEKRVILDRLEVRVRLYRETHDGPRWDLTLALRAGDLLGDLTVPDSRLDDLFPLQPNPATTDGFVWPTG